MSGSIGRLEKYRIAGFPAATNWLISSTVPDSATPVSVPSLVQNIPTRMSQPWTSRQLSASWGRMPARGVACVSHCFEVEDSAEWSAAMAEYNREADAITAALFRAQGEPGLAHLYLTDRRAFDRRMERGRQPLRAAERRARRPICGPRGSSTDPSPGCAKRSGRVVALLSRHPARRPGSCTRNPARVFSTPLRPLRGAGRAGFGRVHVFFSPPGSFSVHS